MTEESRLLDPTEESSNTIDTGLRPKDFSQYLGQERVKTNLKIFVAAAKQRDETSLGRVQGGGSRQDGNPDQCARSRARSKTRGVRPNGCKSSAIET